MFYKVQLNIDVHSTSSRRITASLPKWVSFLSNSTVLDSTEDHAVYYELTLPGFEQTWQAYLLYIQPEDCQKTAHHAVVTMVVPWHREDVHVHIMWVLHVMSSLSIRWNVITQFSDWYGWIVLSSVHSSKLRQYFACHLVWTSSRLYLVPNPVGAIMSY